jgi:hypothetical protein
MGPEWISVDSVLTSMNYFLYTTAMECEFALSPTSEKVRKGVQVCGGLFDIYLTSIDVTKVRNHQAHATTVLFIDCALGHRRLLGIGYSHQRRLNGILEENPEEI